MASAESLRYLGRRKSGFEGGVCTADVDGLREAGGAPALQSEARQDCSELAKARMQEGRGDPLFLADWERAMFLHFEVDAEALQEAVPFELDLWQGDTAVISLVAFTMRGMRPAWGGAATRWLAMPLATHDFLNARTYVRGADGERGIYFLREWLPNLVARCCGPLTYGLPYRLGKLDFRHRHEERMWSGEVCARHGEGRLEYCAEVAGCERDPELRDFLLERYTAFTGECDGLRRKFRVWHEQWAAIDVDVNLQDQSILDLVPGCRRAHFLAAHYAEGLRDVWMGRPRLA